VSRFLPSIGNYIYGLSDKALWVNLFIGNTAEFEIDGKLFKIKQTTDYPRDGKVAITLASDLKKEIRLRLPEWCKKWNISVNDKPVTPFSEKGYIVLNNQWKSGDHIVLDLDMPVEVVAADPRVKENIGKRAVQRGPLVYCAEEIDNKEFDKISITSDTHFTADFEPDLLNGITTITATNPAAPAFKLIPYYAWDNREAGQMKVWLDY
jgi:DUF1680 family protein